MKTVTLMTHSAENTEALGVYLARRLKGGDVLGLTGDLGAGKTTLVRGLASGLGLDTAQVKSPTYVLMHEYPGEIPVIHMDAYRLEGAGEVNALDVDLMFHPHKVTIIEWAKNCEAIMPQQTVWIHLDYQDGDQRNIVFEAQHARAQDIVQYMESFEK